MSYDLTKPLFMISTSASLMLAGSCFSMSWAAIPPMINHAADTTSLLRLWRNLFEIGKNVSRPVALTGALASLASAYTHYHPQAPQRTYYFIASGLLTVGIVPFTLTVMIKNVNKLTELSDATSLNTAPNEKSTRPEILVRDETETLMRRWATLNVYRGLLPLAGAFAAFQAL